jgi:hypothetical protein
MKLSELLSGDTRLVLPGAVFLGPFPGVDHLKFYVIAGMSESHILVCSVLINSGVNSFIQRRPNLLALQVKIKEADYEFLAHDSYVNCASPVKGKLSHFEGASFEYKGALNEADLMKVRDCIRQSGMLTAEELDLYFAV